ncbi:unnamed protein product, partial [Mesorhabditis spiculigera]
MTDAERQRFHGAILQLKRSGKYDQIARQHASMGQSGGAHSGPAFLAWHREFIKRYEFELRRIDPDIYIPYWDSTLESRLPRPQDSCLFSSELMGTGSGSVTSGPFANWRTIEDADINSVMNQRTIDQVLCFTAGQAGCPIRTDFNCLEYTHGNVHLWVGGEMFDQMTSANDPLFYLHHSFVDYIWEAWRQSRQTRAQREQDFPADNQLCSSPQHFGAGRMAPFNPYRNVDGLSNKYTDELYSYAPRPTCSPANPSCGSRFLFCDFSHGAARCVSKVRVGGSCQGFVRGEDSCYNGVCQGSVCRPGAVRPITVAPSVTVRPPVNAPRAADCWNENQCCQTWAAQGECTRNRGYMQDFCKASCNICTPNPPIRDDCSDRHPSCGSWAATGECTKNPDWMTENCRRSCNRCTRTRAQTCSRASQSQATPAPRKQQCENSPGCFNEFACCPLWAIQGQCRTNSQFMTCQCRVSCGMCFPSDYPYGACVDYHRDCPAWARLGECRKNPWMEENCRASCKTCFAQWELRSMCGSTSNAGGEAKLRLHEAWLVLSHGPEAEHVNLGGNRQAFGGDWDGAGFDDGWGVGGAGWGWGGWGRRRRDVGNTTSPEN